MTAPLYVTDDGTPLSTHSMLKSFRRCPKQAEFRYVDLLKPKVISKPLKRGTWIHRLLEIDAKGEDWKQEHDRLTAGFNELFDEERDHYGDLPGEMERLMRSYKWHYADDDWVYHQVETMIEGEWPNGDVYRLKVDGIVENQFGLWVVDHKSHTKLPPQDFRVMDSQSALYLWAAQQVGYDVKGFIWNYLRDHAPRVPQVTKAGQLSKRVIETDFPTMVHTLRKHKINLKLYAPQLRRLKAMRYQSGQPQISPFFRRDVLEKSPAMLKQAMLENFRTHQRMQRYYDRADRQVERNPSRNCSFDCSYVDLCTASLYGAELSLLVKQRYTQAHPLEHYQEEHDAQR